ncbi:MAG: pilus assembly protein [Rhodobacteraceae bacterium CG17_big_fil_post_rev_8_21_14_2_50_65_11]|nr:MAG: pilus assembly protein [Rhodobacteraceae bacterium CG17_big_fil_post_rev_8_21_14_2_50_65_11]
MSTTSLKSFLTDTSGAVTVDWVVLTAALVGLGLAVISVVSGGLEDLSGDINTQLRADHITNAFGGDDG